MTEEETDRPNKQNQQYNVHSATDEEHCLEMESKYGWTLIDVVPKKDPTLLRGLHL